MNRVRSKQGDVLVYQLKENLYTVTQRMESQIVRFFDIKSEYHYSSSLQAKF